MILVILGSNSRLIHNHHVLVLWSSPLNKMTEVRNIVIRIGLTLHTVVDVSILTISFANGVSLRRKDSF